MSNYYTTENWQLRPMADEMQLVITEEQSDTTAATSISPPSKHVKQDMVCSHGKKSRHKWFILHLMIDSGVDTKLLEVYMSCSESFDLLNFLESEIDWVAKLPSDVFTILAKLQQKHWNAYFPLLLSRP